MAENELKIEDEGVIKTILDRAKEAEHGDVARPDPTPPSYFGKIQEQRYTQKRWLFFFAIISSTLVLIGLAIAVGLQAVSRATKNTPLFDNYELQILSGAVFAQTIGTVHIIAKAIWDDRPYTKLLAEDLRDKRKKSKNTK